MAQFTYDSYQQQKATSSHQKIGYFKLKEDNDEALVRFAYDNPSEFRIVTVHSVKVGDSYKRINCNRHPYDAINKCALCEAGNELLTKFYVKIIEYRKDNNGKIYANPKIWERPVGFAKILKGFFDEYGTLSDIVFKIKRHGSKGSLSTTYDVIPTRSDVYKEEFYPKDFSAFESYTFENNAYLIKTNEEIVKFLETNHFDDEPQTLTSVETSTKDVKKDNKIEPLVTTLHKQDIESNVHDEAQVKPTNTIQNSDDTPMSSIYTRPRRYTPEN